MGTVAIAFRAGQAAERYAGNGDSYANPFEDGSDEARAFEGGRTAERNAIARLPRRDDGTEALAESLADAWRSLAGASEAYGTEDVEALRQSDLESDPNGRGAVRRTGALRDGAWVADNGDTYDALQRERASNVKRYALADADHLAMLVLPDAEWAVWRAYTPALTWGPVWHRAHRLTGQRAVSGTAVATRQRAYQKPVKTTIEAKASLTNILARGRA